MKGLFAIVNLPFGCISGNFVFSIIARFSVPCIVVKDDPPCDSYTESLGVLLLINACFCDDLEIARDEINSNICQSFVIKKACF
jgi:hypothetical protein